LKKGSSKSCIIGPSKDGPYTRRELTQGLKKWGAPFFKNGALLKRHMGVKEKSKTRDWWG